MLYGNRVSVFGKWVGVVAHSKRVLVRVMLTMVSVMLTTLRGKYSDFQSKVLFGKRVSVFGKRVGVVAHSKRVLVSVMLTMVSVGFTSYTAK